MFSGVFLLFALRKRVVIGDSPNAVIPTQFQVVAVRLSCKKLFFFSYIHRCFTPLTIWTSINMFIVRICFGKALFSLMKKKQNKENSHTVSPEYAGLHQTNYGVQTTESAVVCSKYRLRSNGRKVVKQITSSYTQGFSFGKYRLY